MSIISFPHWKHKNVTPAEKLYELAEYATRHPEDVNNLVLLWTDEAGNIVGETDSEVRVDTAVYMCESYKLKLIIGAKE
ncbi:MAG: hypothetical protein WC236_15155 [Gallionellaceae bacterium]|jgi:hypothetical protein